jgi:hypothetical protein
MADQYAKVALTEKIYVWTNGGKNWATSDECVISSHGGQSMINRQFRVGAKQEVVFYCPHGNTLALNVDRLVTDPGVNALEVVAANKSCPDYSLSKFQEEAAGETYATLEKKAFGKMDIITVRNRKLYTPPMLSEVIDMLNKAGFVYSKIHCCFCRSPSLPWKTETGDTMIR